MSQVCNSYGKEVQAMIYKIRNQSWRDEIDSFFFAGVIRAEKRAGQALSLYYELGAQNQRLLELAHSYAKLAVRIQEWWRE